MKASLKHKNNEGFSLIELVVVVAVLAILAAIGIPNFNAIIKQALLAITKTSLIYNYKQCKMNSNGEINLSNIPGVVFQSNDCASDITATINSECTLKMNMSTGAKTGWADSYDACVSNTNNSSGNGSGDTNNGTGEQVAIWASTSCSNGASEVLPEYMSKGDKNFTNAYGVLQKWLSDSSNLEKTNSLPNSQSSSNKYHNFQIKNSGEAVFGEFFDGNPDLKEEINNALDRTSESDYQFDVWLNPQGNISVRRLGPQGYWRTAGHKVADCN